MKHDLLTKALAVLFLMAFVVTGCNKDDDPPDPGDLQQLSFDAEEVLALVPAGLKSSNDEYAEQCYSFIEEALKVTDILDAMKVDEGATKSLSKSSDQAWQWTWNNGEYSFTFYWTYEENSSKRYWTMDIQYGSGPRYNYIDAWETMDGKQGELTYNWGWAAIYGGEELDDTEFIYLKYTWSQDASGAYNLSYILDGDSEYEVYNRYDCVINANGSGTIDYYFLDALLYHMDWDMIGNGNWSYYIEGEVLLEGSWSVV